MNNDFKFLLCIYIFAQIFSLLMEGKSGIAQTELTASLSTTEVTTINVNTTNGFLSSNFVIIADESIFYTGSTATTFTGLTRAYDDTKIPKSAYGAGTRVYDEAPGFLNRFVVTQRHEIECGAVDVFCWIKGKFSVVGVGASWITGIKQIMAFDYAYLDGNLVYVKYMYYILSAGLAFSFVRLIWGR